jgi:hypothetical protein
MDVHAVLVGSGSRRSRYREEKAAAQAAYELDLARQVHAQNEKLNRLNRERGQPGRWTCTPKCPVCFPPSLADDPGAGLSVLDLRGKAAPRPKLTGRRGKCRRCGQRCPKRLWYCSDACRLHKTPPAPPRRCAFCQAALPEGATVRRRFCDDRCRDRARRERRHR